MTEGEKLLYYEVTRLQKNVPGEPGRKRGRSMEKFFMHRIKKEAGVFTAGIEVHDSLESAIKSFHGYMKQGYGNPSFPNISYVACFVQAGNGEILEDYAASWLKKGETENKIFLHHIRQDGAAISKAIDTLNGMEDAEYNFHAEMEYGYNNQNHPNVTYQSCMITELLSSVVLGSETWEKVVEPAAE